MRSTNSAATIQCVRPHRRLLQSTGRWRRPRHRRRRRRRRRGPGGPPAVTPGQPRARQRRLQVRGQRTVRWERSAVIAEGRRRRRGKPGQKRGLLRRLLLLLLGMMLTMVVVLLLLLLNLTGLLGVVAVVGELVVERLQVLHVLVRVERARRRRRRGGIVVRGAPGGRGGPRRRGLPGIPGWAPVLLRHGALLASPVGKVRHPPGGVPLLFGTLGPHYVWYSRDPRYPPGTLLFQDPASLLRATPPGAPNATPDPDDDPALFSRFFVFRSLTVIVVVVKLVRRVELASEAS